MSGIDVVLDTNAAILLLKDKEKTHVLDQIKPGGVRYISVITQIELLGYPNITEEDERLIRSFIDGIPVANINISVVEAAIQIRRNKPSLKLPDAVIAATAIELEAALVTNDTDLLKLSFPGLKILNIA